MLPSLTIAAAIIAELKRRYPDLTVYAWGGPKMQAAGATIIERTGDDAVMGMPGLAKIREHRKINDRIAAGSSAGTLYLVDAATGTQRWSQTVPAGISATGWIPWISMAAGDGALAVPGGNSLTVFVSGKKN